MSYGRFVQYDLRPYGLGLVRSKSDWSGITSFYTMSGHVYSETAINSLLKKIGYRR